MSSGTTKYEWNDTMQPYWKERLTQCSMSSAHVFSMCTLSSVDHFAMARYEPPPDQWKCAYCTTVTVMKGESDNPWKCRACGAPRGMGA